MSTNDEDVPVEVSKTKARGGVTGHNVRYVLAFGLVGVIAPSSPSAFITDWVTSRTQHPTLWPHLRARRELPPQGNDDHTIE